MKELQELRQGIYLRRAQEKDSRAIAALVGQLGRTLQSRSGQGFSWREPAGMAMVLWAAIGLGGILCLYYRVTIAAIFTVLLSILIPLGIFLGLFGFITWVNPLINWSDYWVIEHQGSIIACAKLYEGNNTCELYDVFVVPHWRGYGLGTALVKTLMAEARYPLYLACLPTTIGFYKALGFTCTTQPLDLALMQRLSLRNPRYQRLGLTAMVRK